VRRVKRALPEASERRVCRLLAVPRSSLRPASGQQRQRRPLDETLVARIGGADREAPHLRLPQAPGLAQTRRGPLGQRQGGLPHPQGEALVRAPARGDAPSAGPGAQQQRSGLGTCAGRWTSLISTAAPTAGATWRPSSTATTARSSAASSPFAAAPARSSGRWRRPASRASARSDPTGGRRP
jgi:hypothetical protein